MLTPHLEELASAICAATEKRQASVPEGAEGADNPVDSRRVATHAEIMRVLETMFSGSVIPVDAAKDMAIFSADATLAMTAFDIGEKEFTPADLVEIACSKHETVSMKAINHQKGGVKLSLEQLKEIYQNAPVAEVATFAAEIALGKEEITTDDLVAILITPNCQRIFKVAFTVGKKQFTKNQLRDIISHCLDPEIRKMAEEEFRGMGFLDSIARELQVPNHKNK